MTRYTIKITLESSSALNNLITIYNYILYLFVIPIQNMEKSVLKLHFLEYCFQLIITLNHIVSKILFPRCELTFLLSHSDILLDNFQILHFLFSKMELIHYLKNYWKSMSYCILSSLNDIKNNPSMQ